MTPLGPPPGDLPPDWPLAEYSGTATVGAHRWHVQVLGTGPAVLLLHGTGASTHSWRGVAPLLADHARVVMVDLPGHGFTRATGPERASLPAMADDLALLLQRLGIAPDIVVGHSAGAAIALWMALAAPETIRGVVGFNAALSPFRGAAGWVFPVLARTLVRAPGVPFLASRALGLPGQVSGLLASTGSRIDSAGRRQYRQLVSDRRHVAGALAMMAAWDVGRLSERLPTLACPVLLATGSRDGSVPPENSREAAARLPMGAWRDLGALGHLAHEERPDLAAGIILGMLSDPAAMVTER
ncbi:alpha/beta fold hydrolase [Palleronia sediminis]|uniref:Alpha/beta fold hydrolase n=1 Tax=Palleronia sediminis TaxID=2547833 RepID=A0A4V6PP22_9RHOB|nr:alpha/beta fold hydrolase BchO [Palleronia sediminis]TDL75239.1 alpha/beta fold hydrolase [Palleronia sediminis]